MEKKCTIEWCECKYECKWYCYKHYKRYIRYWDPLCVLITPKWKSMINNQLYNTYHAMKNRCYNKNKNDYKNYWWRGITVCDRWLWVEWFPNFILDIGDRPEWCTLDRIDNNWNYCPENCRRSTRHEQQSNRRNNIIEWMSLFDLCNKHWKNYNSILRTIHIRSQNKQRDKDLYIKTLFNL